MELLEHGRVADLRHRHSVPESTAPRHEEAAPRDAGRPPREGQRSQLAEASSLVGFVVATGEAATVAGAPQLGELAGVQRLVELREDCVGSGLVEAIGHRRVELGLGGVVDRLLTVS